MGRRHLYAYGLQKLGVTVKSRGRTCRRLLALPCILQRESQIALEDDESNLVFHVNDFAEVAAIIRPSRRRRPFSATERALRSERLAAVRGRRWGAPKHAF